jgi:S1-C subfamily serine protease
MRKWSLFLLVIFAVGSAGVAKERPAQATAPGWLGFGFELHRDPESKVATWLHVRRVAEAGPAYKAGLRSQDVITAINDKPVAFSTDTAALDFFSSRRAGERVVFTLAKSAGPVRLIVIAAPRPSKATERWKSNYARAKEEDKPKP